MKKLRLEWHWTIFIDSLLVNLFAFYGAKAIGQDNIGGAIVWCGLTLWVTSALVRDISK